jgi:hypothetical protein
MNQFLKLLFGLSFLMYANNSQAQGRQENCLDFDGADDYIEFAVDSSLNFKQSAVTVEAWIYPYGFGQEADEGGIISWYNNAMNAGFYLNAGNSGHLYFGVFDDTSEKELMVLNVVKTNQWTHIAASFGTDQYLRIYMNGVLKDSVYADFKLGNALSTPLMIGKREGGLLTFYGKIDEVRVWKRQLSTGEMFSNYQRRRCGYDGTLRAYYNFNWGIAAKNNSTLKKLFDLSGYKNDGVLKNFLLLGTYSNWIVGKSLTSDVFSVVDTVVRCDRYPAPSGKRVYTSSGTYYDTITTKRGCDSALKIVLTIKKSTSRIINVRTCGPYTGPSGLKTFTQSGTYLDVIKNAAGCDSNITIKLRLGPDSTLFDTSVCDFFILPHSKRSVSTTGWHTDTLKNYIGCDSLIMFNVKIRLKSFSSRTIDFCRWAYIPTNQKIIKTPGTYYDTLVNYVGCDSIIAFIFKSKESYSYFQDFECGSYTSASGKIWTQSGVYFDTIINSKLCDSIIRVDLTITPNSYKTLDVNVCRRWRAPSRKYFITKSGTYRDTIMNLEGCDSIITINATVTQFDYSVEQRPDTLVALGLADNYKWLDCDANRAPIPGENNAFMKITRDGRFAVELSNNDGCKDTSACLIVKKNSQESFNKNLLNISVYPNPATHELNFSGIEGSFDFQILNVVGQQMLSGTSNQGNIQFELSPGMYFIAVSQNGQSSVIRFNVE